MEKVSTETKPEVKPTVETTTSDLSAEQLDKAIWDNVKNQIGNTAIYIKMQKNGLEIPTNEEQLAELEKDYPAYYMQYVDTLDRLYAYNKQQAEGYLATVKQSPIHNNSQKEIAKKQIGDLGTELGIELKPEEIDSFLADVEKNPTVIEQKNGVPFIRENSLVKLFMAEKGVDILKNIKQKAEADKVQAVLDAQNKSLADGVALNLKNKEKTIQSIGTSSTPASTTKLDKIDWSDSSQVKAVGKEARDKKLSEILSD